MLLFCFFKPFVVKERFLETDAAKQSVRQLENSENSERKAMVWTRCGRVA